MPFNSLTTLREAQWRILREFIQAEQSAVLARIRAIDVELQSIGMITVFYEQRQETVQTPTGAEQDVSTVSERRVGFAVSPGSSLETMLQAYIVLGGNPGDISLFLTPDDVQFVSTDPSENPETNPNEFFTDIGSPTHPPDQPYQGVVAVQSTDAYGPGGMYRGGLPTFLRNPHELAGRNVDQSDAGSSIRTRMDYLRRWAEPTIRAMDRLEYNIIKLVDLREQLLQEKELLSISLGGDVSGIPEPDPARYPASARASRIIAEMDRVFYETNEDGSVDMSRVRKGTKESPDGISNYDTLFDNPDGSDPYSSL